MNKSRLDFSIQDEATDISRAAEATAAAATDSHAGAAATVHSATNGTTNHTATDHQSAERSVATILERTIISKEKNYMLPSNV